MGDHGASPDNRRSPEPWLSLRRTSPLRLTGPKWPKNTKKPRELAGVLVTRRAGPRLEGFPDTLAVLSPAEGGFCLLAAERCGSLASVRTHPGGLRFGERSGEAGRSAEMDREVPVTSGPLL